MWYSLGQESKYEKKILSLNEMAFLHIVLDSLFKAIVAKTNDYLWPSGNHLLSNYGARFLFGAEATVVKSH